MKSFVEASSVIGVIFILLFSTVIFAQAQATGSQPVQQPAPARAVKAVPPKTPQASTTLTAPGTVAVSAACCKKTCPDGPAHCGQGCTTVKSISDCSGEQFSNITFECPSNQGMVCVGSSCSCQ